METIKQPVGTISELEKWLTRLIAKQEGVPEEWVTCEWIHEQREKRIYPTVRYEEAGLISLTREEWEKLERDVDEKLEELTTPKRKWWRFMKKLLGR